MTASVSVLWDLFSTMLLSTHILAINLGGKIWDKTQVVYKQKSPLKCLIILGDFGLKVLTEVGLGGHQNH